MEPWKGLARIDPYDRSPLAICDRCGDLEKLNNLRPQYQWASRQLVNTGLQVCSRCWDDPNMQLVVQRLPADPEPALGAKIPPFSIYERNEYSLKPAGLGVPMFGALSSMYASWLAGYTLSPTYSCVSVMTAAFVQSYNFEADITCVSDLDARITYGFVLSPDFEALSELEAEITGGLLIEADFLTTSLLNSALTRGMSIVFPPLFLGTEDGDILATEDDDEITTENGGIIAYSSMIAELELIPA